MKKILLMIFMIFAVCPVMAATVVSGSGVIPGDSLSEDCSGAALTYGNEEKTSGIITYTAQWTPNTYKITYSCGSGTGNVPDQSVTYDAQYSGLNDGSNCTWTDHEFKGWDCTPNIASSGSYTVDGNTSCVAKWRATSCASNQYMDGDECANCPEGYIYTDGEEITNCYKNCTKPCSGNDTANCPANATCTYDTTYSTDGIQHYNVSGSVCEASSSLCPVTAVSCNNNFYMDNDVCVACNVSFTGSGTDTTNAGTCPDGTVIEHATGTSQDYNQICYHTESPAGSLSSDACTGTSNCENKEYVTCYATGCEDGYSVNADATACVPNVITLDWDENGGDNVLSGQCTYGGDLVLPGAPTRHEYSFQGWRTADGSLYSAGETIVGGCINTYVGVFSGTSIGIQAQWDSINCTCTVTNGAVNCISEIDTNNACNYTWSCSAGYYSVTQSANNQSDNFEASCAACPDDYPYSDAGENDAITKCYALRTATCTQNECSNPNVTACSSFTCAQSCSCTGSTYRQYSNSNGDGDGTTSGNTVEFCVKNVVNVTAKSGYYVNGNNCTACPSNWPNSAPNNTGGCTACYATKTSSCVQNNCVNPDPEGCSDVVCALSCQCTGGTYAQYLDASCNANGVTVGTVNEQCTRDVIMLVANAGYYSNGIESCPVCNVSFTNSGTDTTDTNLCPDGITNKAHATGTVQKYSHTCYHTNSAPGSTSSWDCSGIGNCETKEYVDCYITECEDGYYINEDYTACESNEITLDWNENGGSSVPNGECYYGGDLVLPSAPARQGYNFIGWKLDDGTIMAPESTITGGCVNTYIGVFNDTSSGIVAQWDAIICECTPTNGAINCVGTVNENNRCNYTWNCENGYYYANQVANDRNTDYTATCTACPTDYTMTNGSATSMAQCYKSCTKPCTQDWCPKNANGCTYDSTSTTGIQYYGGTCDAEASTCSVTDIDCIPGYYKASYVQEDGSHRYSKGRKNDSDICWHDGMSTNCFGNVVIDLLVHEWMVPFGYGNTYGKSLCSATQGASYSVGNPDEENKGQNCWCKLDKYTLNRKGYVAKNSKWIAISDASWSASSCSNYCSESCANRVQKSEAFRSILFQGTDLYETCALQEYSIDYVLNGGTFPAVATQVYSYTMLDDTVTLPVPTKQGVEFLGWCDDANLTENCSVIKTVPSGSMTDQRFYAKWGFACESDRWLHIGDEKMCLYSEQLTHPALAVKVGGGVYYANLSTNKNLTIHKDSRKKMRVKINGTIYNAYDYSVVE